jgi:hypothetical protein
MTNGELPTNPNDELLLKGATDYLNLVIPSPFAIRASLFALIRVIGGFI